MEPSLIPNGPAVQDRAGAGSLMIDGKKMFGIKHWLELTAERARSEVLVALRDNPFSLGPWGETLSQLKPLFLKSTVNLASIPQSAASLVALDGESTISLDWTLPLNERCQEMLFKRIRIHYEKATAIVDDPQHRSKYRMAEADLMNLRNLVCVWDQIRQFMSSRVTRFNEMDAAFRSGNTCDHELSLVLEQRPQQFAVSFLPSAQQAAVDSVKKQEEVVTMEVQKQRQEVRDVKWKYFQAALQRDQEILSTIQAAPKRLDALRHRKQMRWRIEQSQIGETVVKNYMDRFLRCQFIDKMEHGQLLINEYRAYVVPGFNHHKLYCWATYLRHNYIWGGKMMYGVDNFHNLNIPHCITCIY